MAEGRDSTGTGGSTDQIGVQELVGDAQTILRAFVLLVETVGGTIEYPFDVLADPTKLTDRVVYVEYDESNRMVRYTVKHHGKITGELVQPEKHTNESE